MDVIMLAEKAVYFDIHDRMPVILPADAHDIWLRAGAEETEALVKA